MGDFRVIQAQMAIHDSQVSRGKYSRCIVAVSEGRMMLKVFRPEWEGSVFLICTLYPRCPGHLTTCLSNPYVGTSSRPEAQECSSMKLEFFGLPLGVLLISDIGPCHQTYDTAQPIPFIFFAGRRATAHLTTEYSCPRLSLRPPKG